MSLGGFGARTVAWLGSVVLAVVSIGCGDDPDPGVQPSSTTRPVDPSTTESTEGESSSEAGASTDESSSTTGVEELCPPDSHACTAGIPAGWNGPVVWTQTDAAAEPSACEGSFPLEAFVAFEGLAAPAPGCACDCELAASAACPSTTLRWWAASETCTGTVTAMPVFAGSCNALPTSFAPGSYWTVDPVPTIGGTCAPRNVGVIEPWSFAQRVTACGGAELTSDGCETGEICAPRSDGPLCAWRLGDEVCPEDFAERHLLHRDTDDARGCEPCTCGAAQGLCDTASVTIAAQDCEPVAAFEADSECRRSPLFETDWAYTAWLDPGPATAFCEPSLAVATGVATPIDPVTLCCR